MTCIVFDIETIPDPRVVADHEYLAEWKAENCTAPANYKDPLKILAYEAEAFEKKIGQFALRPWTAQIVCIGWGLLDRDEIVCDVRMDDEAGMLAQVIEDWSKVGKSVWAGFHSRRFDVPMITARCGIHRIRMPKWWPTDGKAWSSQADIRDLFAEGKLDDLLYAHALPRKTASALDIPKMSVEQIREYCTGDVRGTRELVRIYQDRFEALRSESA